MILVGLSDLPTGTRRDAQGINAAIPANYIAPFANSQASGRTLAKLSPTEPTKTFSEKISETDEDVITNDGVISLVRIGLSSGLIVAKIKSSPSKFDTSTQALLTLAEAKVPDDVVIAMMDAQKQSRIAESQTKKALASFREQGSVADLKV